MSRDTESKELQLLREIRGTITFGIVMFGGGVGCRFSEVKGIEDWYRLAFWPAEVGYHVAKWMWP
jgi:hypothetical protein